MSIIKKTKANPHNPDSPSGKRLNLKRKKSGPEISRINLSLSEIILPILLPESLLRGKPYPLPPL